jgi:hypothetical protein
MENLLIDSLSMLLQEPCVGPSLSTLFWSIFENLVLVHLQEPCFGPSLSTLFWSIFENLVLVHWRNRFHQCYLGNSLLDDFVVLDWWWKLDWLILRFVPLRRPFPLQFLVKVKMSREVLGRFGFQPRRHKKEEIPLRQEGPAWSRQLVSFKHIRRCAVSRIDAPACEASVWGAAPESDHLPVRYILERRFSERCDFHLLSSRPFFL